MYRQPFSGHYFQVRLADGATQRSRSLWDASLDAPQLGPGESRRGFTKGPRDQQLLLWSEGFSRARQTFTVTVAEDMAPLTAAVVRFRSGGVVAALAIVALLLLAQRVLLRRAFRRLDRVRTQIQRVAEGADGRLSEEVPEEVQPLVSEINQLLDAWRAHLERSRNSLGNLAHALMAPLNLLLRQAGEADSREQLTRMRGLIERELTRARMAGLGVPGQQFQPHRDLPDVLEAMAKLHAERGLDFTQCIETPRRLPYDREDMLELLGNLLDNAAKWARGRVAVSLSHGRGLTLTVEDDGPGVEPGQVAQLPQRGTRLDETAPGHGLGLAIVQDIARLYGGRVGFERSPRLGGLRVVVSFGAAAGHGASPEDRRGT